MTSKSPRHVFHRLSAPGRWAYRLTAVGLFVAFAVAVAKAANLPKGESLTAPVVVAIACLVASHLSFRHASQRIRFNHEGVAWFGTLRTHRGTWSQVAGISNQVPRMTPKRLIQSIECYFYQEQPDSYLQITLKQSDGTKRTVNVAIKPTDLEPVLDAVVRSSPQLAALAWAFDLIPQPAGPLTAKPPRKLTIEGSTLLFEGPGETWLSIPADHPRRSQIRIHCQQRFEALLAGQS